MLVGPWLSVCLARLFTVVVEMRAPSSSTFSIGQLDEITMAQALSPI
jgi:hypothetical protein